ncbi:hypothetical protein [Solicola gregarius]|uniref:Uncharacterized protein n=1 Tax=Solicola gregarius TaxID=2908642 RepID=A0AA46THH0_9ACTN|nr:hypothetical protein [Solicola gregarius]UYM05439.1 hypothetical protein L0C25_23505 [Solicola gregarius]
MIATATLLAAGAATAPVDASPARPAADAVTTGASVQPPRKLPAKPGRYEGHFYTGKGKRLEPFSFRITKNGRYIKKFHAALEVICSYYPPEVEVHPLWYPKTKVKRNHTFKRAWKPKKSAKIMLRGRFRKNRLVSGKLDYTVGICVRVGYLKAHRVGK